MPPALARSGGTATVCHRRDILALTRPVRYSERGCDRRDVPAFGENPRWRSTGICGTGISRHGGAPLEGSARRHGCSLRGGVACLSRPRRRSHQCARRYRRHRSHRRGGAADHRQRPHPGLDRARQRRDRPPRRGAGARGRIELGGVRAGEFQRRADRPPDRRAALSDGRLEDPVARPRPVAHRQHHPELGRPAGPRRQRHRRHLPHHPRSRCGHHLHRRAAHQQAAADLSVGARRLQGQDQQLHPLSRHRHRHRRPAGAVPDHPVRRQGQRDVSRRRRAGVGGARLYRRRLRVLGQGVRHVGRRRTGVAGLRRGDPRRHPAGVPVRLSQSQPLARPLRPHRGGLARLPRRAGRGRAGRSVDRLGHRPAVAAVRRHRRVRPRHLSRRPGLRPRGAVDPDLVPAGLLGRSPPASRWPGG